MFPIYILQFSWIFSIYIRKIFQFTATGWIFSIYIRKYFNLQQLVYFQFTFENILIYSDWLNISIYIRKYSKLKNPHQQM